MGKLNLLSILAVLFPFLFLFLFFGGFDSALGGVPDIAPAYLKASRDMYDANRSNLRTWQGAARFNYSHWDDMSVLKSHVSGRVDFFFDCETMQRRWDIEKEISSDGQESGNRQEGGNLSKFGSKVILSPTLLIYLAPFNMNTTGGRYVILDEPAKATTPGWYTSDSFDPLSFITTGVTGSPSKILDNYYTKYATLRSSIQDVSQDGDIITLGLKLHNYIFDLSKSGNLISTIYEDPDMGARREQHTEWTSIDGIYVPLTYKYVEYRIEGEKLVRTAEKQVDFVRHILNEPISGDTFEVGGLDLRKDDQIRDIRIEFQYPYSPILDNILHTEIHELGLAKQIVLLDSITRQSNQNTPDMSTGTLALVDSDWNQVGGESRQGHRRAYASYIILSLGLISGLCIAYIKLARRARLPK